MDPYALSDEELLREIGRRVQKKRLAKNLSQSEVARAAGLTRTTMVSLEAGKAPKLLSLLRVLRALGALDQFDNFLPEPGPSPLQLIEMKGKERRRASRSAPPPAREDPAW